VDPGEHEPEPDQTGQVAEDQPGPVLVDPEPPEGEVPGGEERAEPEQRPAVVGGGRVEQGQAGGQAEQAVEGGVPDPGVLVPGVDPALAAFVVQPAAPLVAAPSLEWYESPGPVRSAGRWIRRQPFG